MRFERVVRSMVVMAPEVEAGVDDVVLMHAMERYRKKRKVVEIAVGTLLENEEDCGMRRGRLLPRKRNAWGLQCADMPEFRRHFRMSRNLFERLCAKVLFCIS